MTTSKPAEPASRWTALAGRSLAAYLKFVQRSSRVTVEPEDAERLIADSHPFIFAMWHGQFAMLPTLHTTAMPVSAMVAKHGDAAVIRAVLGEFDIDIVQGAGAGTRGVDRGGAAALRTALRLLSTGHTLAMTADVPPGPARRAGDGIVTLARLSGRPVLPFAVATSRYVALKTWSRMTVNLPFSRLAYVVGAPIFVPRELDAEGMETWRVTIEAAMNRATARAYELAEADPTRATPPPPASRAEGPALPGAALKLYRRGTSLMRPASQLILKVRERQGKEDPARRGERLGQSVLARPAGTLAWVHAASVGETNAVLPVIERLVSERPDLSVLLTTGTVTSARIAAARLPERAVHQYVPLDAPEYAARFLDHWRPDVAIFTESEIWPNLILETAARKIPLVLVNARISARSFKRWKKRPGISKPLFGRFDVILAQTPRFERAFSELGARHVVNAGNLKIDAPPPPVDPNSLAALEAAIGNRPVFLAASTHEGEERIITAVHEEAARAIPSLLTIIAPRHPERGTVIAEEIKARGLHVEQRSLGELPSARTAIYLADTIGELGTLYALAPVAFIGGSFVRHGGQNPIEAVGHGTAVLTGPHWFNFRAPYKALLRHQGAVEVRSGDELARKLMALAGDSRELERMLTGARYALSVLSGALDRTVKEIGALLPAAPGAGAATDLSGDRRRAC